MNQIHNHLKLAKKISSYSTYKIKIGCVISKHNKPIGVGYNELKSHTLFSYPNRKSIHAEINAIRLTGKNYIKGSHAYIYREYKNGLPAIAKPCKYCLERLKNFGVKIICYTISEYPYFKLEKL